MPDNGNDRPWLNADTLRERVALLRDEAESVDGEPCDEWYAEQLDGILDVTTEGTEADRDGWIEDDDGDDVPRRSEPADFGGGDSTGVQDL